MWRFTCQYLRLKDKMRAPTVLHSNSEKLKYDIKIRLMPIN